MANRKQREVDRKKPETRHPKDLSPVTYFLKLGPISLNFQDLPK
jgi:hypothetical protein